jgi:nucleotide-binding universal stress UspA family protein
MATSRWGTVAVAVDGSPHAERALAAGIDLAGRYGSALTILTVAPLTAYVVSTEPWVPAELLEGEVRHYKGILESATARAKAAGLPRVSGVFLEGHISEEIVAYLEKNPVDVLIMGSRGLSATKRLLMGSTSDEVMHHVHCTVMIVRPGPERPSSAAAPST